MTERSDHRFLADVRWTTHGVAHIRADDWGGLGFGQGWAIARDHLPTIADQLVKVRGERARHHGAGPEDAYLASDFGYRALDLVGRAPGFRRAQPDHIQALVTGYTAGYNAWLAEARATDALPPWCASAEWITPIDELDLYTYLGDIALLASGRNLVGILGRAEAPGPDGPAPAAPPSALGAPTEASNGWAFGGEATASGHGIVLANPHFPWGGEARFWECHLTVPTEIDAYGVCLLGAPGIQMGFNEGVAWAHTFSRGHRFTLARLDLVPGSPTRYRHGSDEREMTSTTHAVACATADGSGATTVERTLWASHHGPMVNVPMLGWGLETAYTYRDANLDNTEVFAQFLGMAQATTMDEFQAVFADIGGLPWVNTLAADRTGRAWYTDASPTPNLSATAQERYRQRVQDDMVAALLMESQVALLDGSEPDDDWVDEPGAKRPGLVPPGRLPALERRDYVVNANDSHWLSNAEVPLVGYSPMHGFERTAQSVRTRQNLCTVARLASAGSVTAQTALDAVLSNESLTAELLRDAVVARGQAGGTFQVEALPIDVGAAVEVLAAWDGRFDLDSRGALLWREFMAGFEARAWLDAGALFSEPFDPDRPVATPAGLAPAPPDAGSGPASDPVVGALATAVAHLAAAGLAPDASVAEGQWVDRGDERVAVHGGGEGDGVANVLVPVGALASHALEPGPARLEPVADRSARTGLRVGGYRCTYGTSFLMAVELTDDGPVGLGLVAYGQSGDPRSSHHRDGTDAYAAKQVRPLLFHDAEIESDPNLIRRTLEG
ncbi:MAG: penicillin acylase family protein [Acidimicrobiales bacterium]